MKNSTHPNGSQTRRGFIHKTLVFFTGALTTAAYAKTESVENPTQQSKPPENIPDKGYHLTEHIQKYYDKTRV